jgi:hypothetical protein
VDGGSGFGGEGDVVGIEGHDQVPTMLSRFNFCGHRSAQA